MLLSMRFYGGCTQGDRRGDRRDADAGVAAARSGAAPAADDARRRAPGTRAGARRPPGGGGGVVTPDAGRVTVVVTCHHQRDSTLRTVGRLTGPVVVVDNGSHDGTVEALQALGRDDVTVVPLRRDAGTAARRVGVLAVRTPLVAFADDGWWWDAAQPGPRGRGLRRAPAPRAAGRPGRRRRRGPARCRG
nr:glycosyltransferase [Angustibacter aerolatus]